ncbi:SIMPL domain-containing protein [Bradyrhizobium sp. HKCCYLR20261]|uniref:SIMPL domain-containing protein n=1 Tax=Bradyrhizobium sp. HKCCYLR20261 TaxID=3420760 RepID=UPI003EBC72AC
MPHETIASPFNITVFGSAIERISPDFASIKASVSCIEQKPADAFSKAKQRARSVTDYLRSARVKEFGMSRASLTRELQPIVGAPPKFVGYRATIAFRIIVSELDLVDEITDSIIKFGASQIEQLSFGTSSLREFRQRARRLAVTAAFEKATNYCKAAGVLLGPVISIMDMNPDFLAGGGGHGARGPQRDDEGEAGFIDPGMIEVAGAVTVVYEIRREP